MAQDIATLGLAIDSRQVKTAATDLDKLTDAGKKTEREVTALEAANRQLQTTLNSLLGPLRLVRDLLAAMAAAESVRRLIAMADAYNTLQARIKTATAVTNDYARVSAELFAVSQRTGSALEVNVSLFQALARSAPALGATNAQILKLVEVSQQLAVIGGAGPEEMANGMRQFAQAMGSGVLRGDELNAILEQLPELANRIAKGMNVTTGQLRSLGEAGKLTGRDITEGLLKQAGEIEAQFNSMPLSVARATTMLENAFSKLVGETDQSHRGTQTLAQGMKALADNLSDVVDKALLLGTTVGSVLVGRGLGPAIAAGASWLQQQIALNVALATGAAEHIAGAAAIRGRAEASLQAAQAAAAETNSIYLTAQANVEFAASALAATRAEIALEQVRKEAQINTLGRLERQREIMALRQIEARQIEILTAHEAALTAAAAANVPAMAAAAAATAANAAAIQSTTLGARAASVAMGALKSVMAFFGGPIGLAITVLTLGIGYFATAQTDAERATTLHQKAMQSFNEAMSQGKGGVAAMTEEVKALTRSQLEQAKAASEAVVAEQNRYAMASNFRIDKAAYDMSSGLGLSRSQVNELIAPARELQQQFLAGSISATELYVKIEALSQANPKLKPVTQALEEWAAPLIEAKQHLDEINASLDKLGSGGAQASAKLGTTFESMKANLQNAAAAVDMALDPTKIGVFTNSEMTLAQHTKSLNEILGQSPEMLKRMGVSAEDVTRVLTLLQQKLDPVAQAVKQLNDESKLMGVPAGIQRDIAAAQQQAKNANGGNLGAGQADLLAGAVTERNTAALRDHNRELQQKAKLDAMVAAASTAGAAAQAAAQRKVELYNQALKLGGVEMAELVLKGKPLPELLQQTDAALKASDMAQLGAQMAKASKEVRLQAEGQERLASAATVSSDAMGRMQVHNEAVTRAFQSGIGSVEQWEKELLRVYEAERLTARNEWVRGIGEQVAANDNLTRAYRDGSDAAIKSAERQNEIDAAVRQYGITVEQATEQVDRLRNSQNDLDLAKQTDQFREQTDAVYALTKKMEDLQKVGADSSQMKRGVNDVMGSFAGGGDRVSKLNSRDDTARQMENLQKLIQAQKSLPIEAQLSAEQMKAYYEDAYDAMLSASDNWQDGAELAMRDYVRTAENGSKRAYDFVNTAFKGMEDGIVSFVKTGKFEMSDFFNSIIDGLIRMAVQMAIIEPLARGLFGAGGLFAGAGDWFTGLFGGGGSTGVQGDYVPTVGSGGTAVAHVGGIAGMGTGINRYVDPSVFAGAQRRHGGGLAAGEVPIIAMQDEEIITRKDPRHRWNGGSSGGGGGTIVNIYDQRTVTSEDDKTTASRSSSSGNGMDQVDVYIGEAVTKGFDKGAFDGPMNRNFGQKRTAAARR